MTLGASYATTAQLKGYLGITDSTVDSLLTECLSTASRAIEKFCGRQFNDAGATSARVYCPINGYLVKTEDFSTITGLIVKVDTADAGTYDTTVSDVQAEPLNGVVDGEPGWPFWRLRTVATTTFPTYYRRAPIQVTARWGWTAVPAGVYQACILLAEEAFKLKGAPFGVASTDQFGPIRVRDNPKVMGWLAPYRLSPVLMA